jgi:hypothetical protein
MQLTAAPTACHQTLAGNWRLQQHWRRQQRQQQQKGLQRNVLLQMEQCSAEMLLLLLLRVVLKPDMHLR